MKPVLIITYFVFMLGCANTSMFGCASAPIKRNVATVKVIPSPVCSNVFSFGRSAPETEEINLLQLLNITEWVLANPQVPVLSFTISRNGHVVYELLTSSLTGEEAHYIMSATKSVTSSLVGIAIDQGYLQSPQQKIADVLPANIFSSDEDRKRFSNLNIKDVLGMSALNAPLEPHENTPEAKKRLRDWESSKNRVRFALSQPLLARPGKDFFYTDITPSLAAGVVEYNTHQSLYDFANQNLFLPMEFLNQEWMHEDPSGIDNGAFGLRLRPIDMQKFGILFLNKGCWNNRQLISRQWVDQSFEPWIESGHNSYSPDYGWYWWKDIWATGWTSYGAIGWKGQRIEVFPEKKIVVTMTALINDGSEDKVFFHLMRNFVLHLTDPLPSGTDIRALKAKLDTELYTVRAVSNRISPDNEARMIPSIWRKERHFPFDSKTSL